MRARIAIAALLLYAAPALAQDPNYTPDRTSAPMPPTVSFTNAPVWVKVPGSPVMVLQSDQRPGYDMFTLNNQYYIYKDNYWYRSDVANGPYVSLELNAIPPEMHSVPRATWVSYPAGWADASASATIADTWTPTVTFSTVPHWETVPGSARVYYVRKAERPAGYDLYQYNGRYYTYQKNNWYSAQSVNGPYTVVTSSDDVPMAFRTVKKTYWVNYPSGWTYMTPGAYNNSVTKVKIKTETK